jgi:hypothetical protein
VVSTTDPPRSLIERIAIKIINVCKVPQIMKNGVFWVVTPCGS